jgi:transcription elongation factor Elf1
MNPSEGDFICPVCGQWMRLSTVLKHAAGEQTFVLQCRPCGLSTTKTVEGTRRGLLTTDAFVKATGDSRHEPP